MAGGEGQTKEKKEIVIPNVPFFLQRNTSGVLIARFMMQPYFHFTNV